MASFTGNCAQVGSEWRVSIKPPAGYFGARTEWRRTEKAARALLKRRLNEAEAKVGKDVEVVVSQCRAGKTLCTANRVNEAGRSETTWFFEPGGRACGAHAAQRAIEAGLVKPRGDSLLDPSFSQSWVAA